MAKETVVAQVGQPTGENELAKGTSWRKVEASRRFEDMGKFLEGAT